MIRIDKPEEIKQVDDLELVRLTRYETIDRYGISPMHYRAQVIREQVLTAETLKALIRRVLEMPDGTAKGRIRWTALLPLVPVQPHGLDEWDVRWAAEENLRTEENRFEAPNGVWWWRLRTVYDIPDPAAWVVEQWQQREKGWAKRLLEMAYGEGQTKYPAAAAHQLVSRCRAYLQKRKPKQTEQKG